ncbi:related to peroxisomal targeting signal receptor [Fusarium fujikuroi]|nr:related to peroxisomal targeting signal receptor [Fusarium fujikuroi]SCN72216.1 related to peroxisomal targeting signal receptor [Fusarium fujikuroi]SCO06533.1 related to peroxisomal targeting signal receptor [Fusarium fujikuroi]SCO30324.1 related to peroxisomal targeting signal receptor [Fusarium fujikuroi]SCV28205.1 related to peroxisomal targeting signal receptor [Fusarium fujikuroi]
MSFMGGAECSTSANPLSQLHKHTQNDRTLQQDRLVGRGPGGQLNGFRSQSASAPQDEMMNGFLNQGPSLQQEFPMQPSQMAPLSLAQSHMRANSASPTWAHDFNGQPAMESTFQAPPAAQSHFNADEFARFQQLNTQGSSARASPMQSNVPSQMNQQRPMMGGMMNRPMGYTPMFQPMYQNQQPMRQPQQQDLKGKGRLVELDDHKWEEQFASMELQDNDKAKEQEEANAAEQELNEMDKGLTAETNEQDFDQFDTEWSNNMMPDFEGMGDWGRLGDPAVETYLFEQDNFFRDEKNAFEEGVRIMREGGNLSLAALAFESAVQQNPNHTEAWVYLGTAQAQNEKETAAIRALEQALKLDPNNLAALMGLAVSYTNEGYDSTAYRTLERWLSVKYPNILDPKDLHPPAEMGFTDRQQLHDKVTNLFIKAAQLSPDGEHMDPDVQVGLGVLFYGAEDYDKAVDCFQSALHSSEVGTSNQQEQLHLLWNRLGATLANSGRSEEAIAAYQEALAMAPNFVRARYNLGVSCINIHCHHEAACHFLAALEMHKAIEKSGRSKAYEILGDNASGVDETLDRMSAQNRSSTLYDTLRRVFTQMGRRDLAEKTVAGVDPDVFRPEFEF